jgi:hypothetical protein
MKISGSIKYGLTEKGIKNIAAILCMLTNDVPMVCSVINTKWKEQHKDQLLELDKLMLSIHNECQNFKDFKMIKTAA